MRPDVENRLTEVLERCYRLGMEPSPIKSDGGAIAYFPMFFPEELAHAAGALPQAILGGGHSVEIRRADALIGSFVCSICRSTTELGLDGALAGMTCFYVPPICDPVKHLVAIWDRNVEDHPAEILALPQNIGTSGATQFVYDEFQRVRHSLELRLGRPVPDDAIRSSINVYNRTRQLRRTLALLRSSDPPSLSATEHYLLERAGTRMPREEHNDLLREVIDLLAHRPTPAADKPRVIFLGGFCEQPPLEMIETIEEACYVVDDDLLLGLRWITNDVRIDIDPVWALAEAFVASDAWSPVQYDARRSKVEPLLLAMKNARADAVILSAPKFCEPGLDDQTLLVKALSGMGVPHAVLEFEEKLTSFEQMSMQIETFAEALLFVEEVK